MTPERKKWWVQLSDKEKYLRISIKACEADIKMSKLNLKLSRAIYKTDSCLEADKQAIEFAAESRKRHLKHDIRQRKYILTALKHELERGGTCDVIYRCVNNLLMATCDKCGAVLVGGNSKPIKFCPGCGRKIKELE